MAATTASINMAIPGRDTVIPSFFSKIIKLTPIMEKIIPSRFIRVIFSFKKKDEVKEVNKGIVAIITAASVEETNLTPKLSPIK
jgi:hypothetical protein